MLLLRVRVAREGLVAVGAGLSARLPDSEASKYSFAPSMTLAS